MKTPLPKFLVIATACALGGCVEPYGYVDQHQYSSERVVSTLPSGYRTVTISGTRYYTHNDVYYRPQGSSYVVVDSPHGGRTTYVERRDPRDYDRRGYSERRDHYDRGPSRYEVGTIVRRLPDGYRTVSRRGTTYYVYNDSYFRPHSSGYVVVDYR